MMASDRKPYFRAYYRAHREKMLAYGKAHRQDNLAASARYRARNRLKPEWKAMRLAGVRRYQTRNRTRYLTGKRARAAAQRDSISNYYIKEYTVRTWHFSPPPALIEAIRTGLKLKRFLNLTSIKNHRRKDNNGHSERHQRTTLATA